MYEKVVMWEGNGRKLCRRGHSFDMLWRSRQVFFLEKEKKTYEEVGKWGKEWSKTVQGGNNLLSSVKGI